MTGATKTSSPCNVGLLFFNEAPDKFFPGTQIDIVHFPEGGAGNKLEERIFQGALHQQLRDALKYLRNMVIQERVTKIAHQAEAERVFNYPYEAIEEALVNAVYHRSYEQREPIEVRVNPDRIEIISYPGSDPSISLKALAGKKVVSRRYRNRRIGEFLKELDLTEGRGTGIPKIYGVLKANGSPPPRFETDEARTYFLAEIQIHSAFIGQAPVEAPEEALVVELSDTERAILELCKSSPKSKREILAALGYKTMTGNTKQALQRLTDFGLITLTIPATPNSKLQRRRITAKGLAALRTR